MHFVGWLVVVCFVKQGMQDGAIWLFNWGKILLGKIMLL